MPTPQFAPPAACPCAAPPLFTAATPCAAPAAFPFCAAATPPLPGFAGAFAATPLPAALFFVTVPAAPTAKCQPVFSAVTDASPSESVPAASELAGTSSASASKISPT